MITTNIYNDYLAFGDNYYTDIRPCGTYKNVYEKKYNNKCKSYYAPCNICDPYHNNINNHFCLPCFNQHKPYGMVTCHHNMYFPFIDDDKPDWHIFHPKKRKPMKFEEVIDENGCSHGPHGTINVKPIEPENDISEEIEDTKEI